MQYKITRTSKSGGIKVTVKRDSSVEVKAGYRVSGEEIDAFLAKHKRWLVSQVAKHTAYNSVLKIYESGDVIRLHAKDYPVRYESGQGKSRFDGEEVVIYTRGDYKTALDKWYKEYATTYLRRMFALYAGDVCPVKIKRVKSYYGCCYRRGKDTYISLNLALVHGDDECIRYVINHELSHLKVPNHGADFYRELERREPNYRDIERRLKDSVLL